MSNSFEQFNKAQSEATEKQSQPEKRPIKPAEYANFILSVGMEDEDVFLEMGTQTYHVERSGSQPGGEVKSQRIIAYSGEPGKRYETELMSTPFPREFELKPETDEEGRKMPRAGYLKNQNFLKALSIQRLLEDQKNIQILQH